CSIGRDTPQRGVVLVVEGNLASDVAARGREQAEAGTRDRFAKLGERRRFCRLEPAIGLIAEAVLALGGARNVAVRFAAHDRSSAATLTSAAAVTYAKCFLAQPLWTAGILARIGWLPDAGRFRVRRARSQCGRVHSPIAGLSGQVCG